MLPRIGIFANEWSADIMVPIFQQLDFLVTAIWGRTEQIAQGMASKFNIGYSTSKLDDLLLRKDVDLICIGCPPFLHAEIAVKALGIGKHVICQQPTGLTISDTQKMIDAARYYPSLLSLMAHETRFLPAYAEMKNLITQNYCGPLLLCEVRIHTGPLTTSHYNWLCNTRMGGGALNTIGSGVVDILSFLTDSKAVEVLGYCQTFVEQKENIKDFRTITSDDFCSFQMKMNSGLRVHVTINTLLPDGCCQEIIIIGHDGRLIIRNNDLFGFKNDNAKEEAIYRSSSCQEINGRISPCQTQLVHTPTGLEFIKALKSAFETCRNDTNGLVNYDYLKMSATFEDSYYIRAVINAIRESNYTRTWHEVKRIS